MVNVCNYCSTKLFMNMVNPDINLIKVAGTLRPGTSVTVSKPNDRLCHVCDVIGIRKDENGEIWYQYHNPHGPDEWNRKYPYKPQPPKFDRFVPDVDWWKTI